jgi:5'-nucleotidase/UDP-sugar diphosphatase
MGVIFLSNKKWKMVLGLFASLAMICVMVALMPLSWQAQAQDEGKRFTILHTNDEHSEVIPHDLAIDYPTYPTIGGFSRIASTMAGIKAQKAAEGEPVLTLSAGDYNQGTLFGWLETSNFPPGAVELTLMQMMGYDAIALGNHDFDMGSDYRAGALNNAKALGLHFPILCSNIQFGAGAAALQALYSAVDLQGTQLAIQDYTIKDLPNGLKVGIFGLMGVEAEAVAPAAAATGVTFGNVPGHPEDPVSFFNRTIKSQQMVDTLRAAGCDVVVALTHSGITEDIELAKFVNGIDVIVGGHSHDLVYPPVIEGASETIIVQAKSYTEYLGVLELEYAGGKVSIRNANAIKMDENVPTDPTMDAAIANFKAILDAMTGMDILAPMAETDLGGDGGFTLYDGPPYTETNLGDLITDAYRTVVTGIQPAEPVRLGFEANGTIRSSILKGGLGRFSFYDLHRTIPLGGSATDPSKLGYSMVSFYLFGAEIQGVLEATLAMGDNQFFVQLSGARYYYRPAAPDNSKVVSFEVDDGAGGWEPLNPGALYKVATNYYVASFLALFGVGPRDNTGAPTTLDASIVHASIPELRAWEALAGYVGAMPDLDGDGIPNIPPTYKLAHDRITASYWYLAEGSTDGGMETFLLVQNPNDADVHVNIAFQTDMGEVAPEMLQGVGIPANSRVTFKVNDFVTNFDVSTTVAPIDGEVICERSMYGNNRMWAHDSIGVTATSPTWYLAEGSTDGGMETFVLVQNPYGEATYAGDEHVDIAFQTDAGEIAPPDLQGATIPASSRVTYKANDYTTNYNVSTYVEGLDGNVVCERSMYGDNRTWAHDSIGATAPAPTWYLAEGSTDGGMETFVLVQNPGMADAHVNIAFQTDAGEVVPPVLQGVTVPAMSRVTFKANDFVTNYNVSTKVEATNGNVVCERAMYGNNRTWAHDSIGVTAPAPTWYLAEGSTDGGMETFVLVQNPGNAAVNVNIAFQTDMGELAPPALQGVAIPAMSRVTFKANDFVTSYNVSTMVEATNGNVVCERSMYGNDRTWAHDSIGYSP